MRAMPTLTEFLTGRHGGGSPAKDQATSEHDGDRGHAVTRAALTRVIFVALATAAVGFHVYEPFSSFSLIGVAATLIGGYPIFRETLENIMEMRMTMEISMTNALAATLLIGEPFTDMDITMFLLGAEIMVTMTRSTGKMTITGSVGLYPHH